MGRLPQIIIRSLQRLNGNLGLLRLRHLALNHQLPILPNPRITRQHNPRQVTDPRLLHIPPIHIPIKLNMRQPAARPLRHHLPLLLAILPPRSLHNLDIDSVTGFHLGVTTEHTQDALGDLRQHVLVLEGVEFCGGFEVELLAGDGHLAAQVEGGLAGEDVVDYHVAVGQAVGVAGAGPEDEVAGGAAEDGVDAVGAGAYVVVAD